MRVTRKAKKLTLSGGLKSFLGYLEGTQKSKNTIKNYKLDIQCFLDFISSQYPGKNIEVSHISRTDIEEFRKELQKQGLMTNTRRRKLLTVTQFLGYLAKRKKVSPVLSQKVPAPHKVEKVPFTLSTEALIHAIQALPQGVLLEERNRLILWVLAETGCLVSELSPLRYEQFQTSSKKTPSVEFFGKFKRTVPISLELYEAVLSFKKKEGSHPTWIFLGFNKYGNLGHPITDRGVELLVKSYAKKLGSEEMTPRTLRHSAVVFWYRKGLQIPEIQARLGLKTTYAFRAYEPLFKSTSETMSKS